MSGLAGFSKCRIQFIPNDQQRADRNYSDRSLIELREIDFPICTLRAIDIENDNEEIFNIPLKKENQCKYGGSDENPDEISNKDGTYRIWLNKTSRDTFYKELNKYFEQLKIMTPPDEVYQESDEDDNSDYNNRDSDSSDDDIFGRPVKPVKPTKTVEPVKPTKTVEPVKPTKTVEPVKPTKPVETVKPIKPVELLKPVKPVQPDPSIVSPKDLLLDVHHLSTYIEQGDVKAAAQIASQLASNGVQLQATLSKNARNEKEFTIFVQLDGNEYGIDQHGAKIPVDVFQSTTIRELRAVFELAYQYPPTNQYFFVNGRLAHDNLTMKDLNVGPNSLFVLFLLTHSKTFKKAGPWQCSACTTSNQQNNARCISCSAARKD